MEDPETIRKLFYEQVRALTKKTTVYNSLDYQFSDRWMR